MDLYTNLAGYWPLAENGNDYSGNGRNFTSVGTPVHATVDGFRCAQGLNATNYYTNASVSWWASKSVFTVAGWFRRTTTDASNLHAAVTFGGAVSVATVMYPINQNITTGYREFCNNQVTFFPNDNVPTAGGWRFICRVVESAAMCRVYRDAAAAITYTATSCATPASMTGFRLGNYYNGGVQAYDGDVRDLRVWVDRALTAAEVAELYAGAFGGGASRLSLGLGLGI